MFEREMQSLSRLILLHGRNNLIYHAENAWYLKNLQLLQYGIFLCTGEVEGMHLNHTNQVDKFKFSQARNIENFQPTPLNE